MARNVRTENYPTTTKNGEKETEYAKSHRTRFIASISWRLKLNDTIMPYYKSCTHRHTQTHSLALIALASAIS